MDNDTQRGETIEIEVSTEDVAKEVAYALIGRAQTIHDSPIADPDEEKTAIELRDRGQQLLDEYE